MTYPVPQPGLVINYAYLWSSEQARGLEEGLKDRPCVIVAVRAEIGKGQTVIVAPITHTPPTSENRAVEIPAATKRRLSLDEQRSWVLFDEVNKFNWPGPDLRPIRRYEDKIDFGMLPPKLFREIRAGIVDNQTAKRLRFVKRSDAVLGAPSVR